MTCLLKRMLSVLGRERAVRAELRAIAGEQAAGLAGTPDELREYARGIHPAILTDGGPAPALETLARRSPVPVTLEVHLAGRLAKQVEVTAYYVVSEALANAAKHARASAVYVGAGAAGDVLRLAVRDDGIGGADPACGSGLAGLNDRVTATGGTLRLHSRPGEGTTPRAELPAWPGQPPPASRPDGEISLRAGPGAPDDGSDGPARTRVPLAGKRGLPGRPGHAPYWAGSWRVVRNSSDYPRTEGFRDHR